MEVTLQINGQKIAVPEGTTIMEAANRLGVYIPHFCYHEKLSIAANCRMCMVDIEKSPKALPACATPVMDGMVVRVDSPKAKAAQNSVMEFLLINHPLDCPICDQGGECQLQDLAVGYGISRSRYQEEKRVVFEKNLGPLIATDMTRCIHCTRCVRFGREVAGIMELGMTGRGEHAEIMPFVEKTVDSELSGNMIDICPVGALTSKPFRFSARTWEMTKTPATASHDSWGSHVEVHHIKDAVKRVVPDRSPGIYEHWISDRDRFSYEGLAHAQRAGAPLCRIKKGHLLKETSWHRALAETASQLCAAVQTHGADTVGFFVSPRATCEEAYLLQSIARHLGCKHIDSRLYQRDFSADSVGGVGGADGSSVVLDGGLDGLGVDNLATLKAALLVGAEPARELPLLAAYMRKNTKQRKWMAVSPLDLRAQVPLSEQCVAPPQALPEQLIELLLAAGGQVPPSWKNKYSLFAVDSEQGETHRRIIAHLQKAGADGTGVIWLGDIARAHPHYGLLVILAQMLAAQTGCRVGTLADLANGVGVRRAGAVPAVAGVNTAQMLAAPLKAIIMFRCDAEDFCQPLSLQARLVSANFVCSIATHTDEPAAQASHTLLPCADFAENAGTVINGFGNITQTAAVVAPPGEAKPGWKILRVLGELLAVPGFDFSDLTSIRAQLQERLTAPPTAESAADSDAATPQLNYKPQESAPLAALGGQGIYRGDALVRHAAALQATRQGQLAATVCLCRKDIQALGVQVGDAVRINDIEERVVAEDDRLAQGCVRIDGFDACDQIQLTAAASPARKTA